MHELSIIQNIADIVLSSAQKHGVEHITAVEVEVGQFSGIVKEALEFAWNTFSKDAVLEGARLVITQVPARAQCRNCHTAFNLKELFDPCPECGTANPDIIGGRELRVVSIET
jgi:hydrogenase nickel incorporation protein HypA/HybF